jgi:hypothetical protein
MGLANGGLLEAPGLAAAAPGSLAAFASRLPDWADRFPEARRVAPAAPAQALNDLLRAASGEQPLVLLLDDAQWSDRDSLLALGAAWGRALTPMAGVVSAAFGIVIVPSKVTGGTVGTTW